MVRAVPVAGDADRGIEIKVADGDFRAFNRKLGLPVIVQGQFEINEWFWQGHLCSPRTGRRKSGSKTVKVREVNFRSAGCTAPPRRSENRPGRFLIPYGQTTHAAFEQTTEGT